MDMVVFRVLMAAMSLLGIDLIAYGFAFGFGVFALLSASMILLCWVCRPLVGRQRRKAAQCWHWEQFGNGYYQILEVA